jgi:hypothetical protein
VAVTPAAFVGHVWLPRPGPHAIAVPLLAAPADDDLAVHVTSANPAVVEAQAETAIPAGGRTARVAFDALAEGTSDLRIEVGPHLTVVPVTVGQAGDAGVASRAATVGQAGDAGVASRAAGLAVTGPPPLARIALAQAAAVTIRPPATLYLAPETTVTLEMPVAPATEDAAVSAVSRDPRIAEASAPEVLRAGERALSITVRSGSAGRTVIDFELGGRGALSVVVGAPDDPETTFAPLVGVKVNPQGPDS